MDVKLAISENTEQTENKKFNFKKYLSLDKVERGLKYKKLIKSKIRISKENFRKAYVTDSNDLENDLYIEDTLDRHRALDGDIVIAQPKEKYSWKIIDEYRE